MKKETFNWPWISACVRVITVIIVALIALEFLLRWLVPFPDRYYIHPPGIREKSLLDVRGISNVSPNNRFYTNTYGLQGDEYSSENKYRILVIGNSTTECRSLTFERKWPYRIQEELNARFGDRYAWVVNAGRSGNTSRHHILQLQRLQDDLPHLDVVLIMMGVSDISYLLHVDKFIPMNWSDAQMRDALVLYAFSLFPHRDFGSYRFIYRRTALWRTASRINRQIKTWQSQMGLGGPMGGRVEIIRRPQGKPSGPVRWAAKIPDSRASLAEYRAHMDMLHQLGVNRRTRVIFITQPTLWRADLSEDTKARLWMEGADTFDAGPESPFYSLKMLEKLINAYNNTLIAHCREQKWECIDLAKEMNRDDYLFYDTCHLNELGAQRAAEIISRYLHPRPDDLRTHGK